MTHEVHVSEQADEGSHEHCSHRQDSLHVIKWKNDDDDDDSNSVLANWV